MQGLVDYVGQKIGKLVVEDILPPQVYKYRNTNRRYPVLKVRCECGRERAVRLANLKSGNTTSCGCCVKIGNQSKKKKTNKMNFQVVTVSNRKPHEWYYLTEQFVRSLKGHPVLSVDYSREGDLWKGLMTKPKWLYRAIMEGKVNKDYIIFADSWDLVFATDPEEIMEAYDYFNADIVISTEKNCFPHDHKEDYDKLDTPPPYKYLNSGFIVGKTDSVLACLETMDLVNQPDDHYDNNKNQMFHGNDQLTWQKTYLQQPVNIKLDYEQILSQTLHDADVNDFDFNKGRIKNRITGSFPCSFHFNGSSKDRLELREPILRHLKLM